MPTDIKPTFSKLLDDVQLAEALGVSRAFLKADRCGERLIPFFRIGVPGKRGPIRYDLEKVSKALESLSYGGAAKGGQP